MVFKKCKTSNNKHRSTEKGSAWVKGNKQTSTLYLSTVDSCLLYGFAARIEPDMLQQEFDECLSSCL